MRSVRDFRSASLAIAAILSGATAAALSIVAAGTPVKPAAQPPGSGVEFTAPVVADTKTNLQQAFGVEMNAKERYKAYANQAQREGYPGVARIFSACATAEQVHADRHVHAIAVIGGEARVMLDRVFTGSTEENLKAAIGTETYEATQYYPALIARARADGETEAVRSMNFAMSAEREHERLLATALASLEERPEPRAIYVCSFCGKTVESLDLNKCPNCFTPAKKFTRVGEPAAAGAKQAGAAPPAPVPAPPEPGK